MIARRALALLVLLASLSLPGAARAGVSVELVKFGDVPVNVVLPDGYDSGPLRYPVIYLLHGYSENENTWLDMGNLAAFAADKQAIFVTPGGDPDGWYSDWRNGANKWESFHIGTLIPYIDTHYRTIGARAGRAIAGLSMGGFGSMSYAARHPVCSSRRRPSPEPWTRPTRAPWQSWLSPAHSVRSPETTGSRCGETR
ncbi:MAG: alpha/beta hydrolase-fold protein [Actinomycetota bacterium]